MTTILKLTASLCRHAVLRLRVCPLARSPLPKFTATLREPLPFERMMHAKPSHGLQVVRGAFPQDSDRYSASRARTATYSFGSGRTFGAMRPEPRYARTGSVASFAGGMEASRRSFGSTASLGSTKSASGGGGGSGRKLGSVTRPSNGGGYSNFSNPIGSSIWTGASSPGNRSFYPLGFGRHTFAPRTPVPTLAGYYQK